MKAMKEKKLIKETCRVGSIVLSCLHFGDNGDEDGYEFTRIQSMDDYDDGFYWTNDLRPDYKSTGDNGGGYSTSTAVPLSKKLLSILGFQSFNKEYEFFLHPDFEIRTFSHPWFFKNGHLSFIPGDIDSTLLQVFTLHELQNLFYMVSKKPLPVEVLQDYWIDIKGKINLK